MSHRHGHHHHDHGHDGHHGRHRDEHRRRGRGGLQRRLRRAGDDVTALEELQRDLEQATADVAARISALRKTA